MKQITRHGTRQSDTQPAQKKIYLFLYLYEAYVYLRTYVGKKKIKKFHFVHHRLGVSFVWCSNLWEREIRNGSQSMVVSEPSALPVTLAARTHTEIQRHAHKTSCTILANDEKWYNGVWRAHISILSGMPCSDADSDDGNDNKDARRMGRARINSAEKERGAKTK